MSGTLTPQSMCDIIAPADSSFGQYSVYVCALRQLTWLRHLSVEVESVSQSEVECLVVCQVGYVPSDM